MLAHLKTGLGVAMGAIAALWLSLGVSVQILVLLIALDLVTGMFAAWAGKRLDSATGWRGVSKKALTLGVVAAAAVVDPVIDLPLAEFVAGFYAAVEALSIIENAAVAGVPVPSVLRDALTQWQRLVESRDRERREEARDDGSTAAGP